MHGTVRDYLTPAGAQRWEFSIELGIGPDGRRKQSRRRGFASEAAAREAMDAELVDRRRGQYIEPDRTPLGDYLRDWLNSASPSLSPNTVGHYRNCLARMATIEHIPLAKLQPQHVQRWVNDLSTRYSPNTVRRTHTVLATALAQAVRWGHLPASPARHCTLPRIPTRREAPVKTWTAEEAARFLRSIAGDPHEALWRLLLDGQLRGGEARALRWADVDLEAAVVHVRRTASRNQDGQTVIGSTAKTPSSVRDVTISRETVAALRRHRTAQLERRLRLAYVWEDNDLVFPAQHGQCMTQQNLAVRLDNAIDRAGVPRITPHSLRHTGASLLVMAGVPLVVVSRRLGHANISVTADVYSHVTQDADRAASDTLARLLNA